MKKEVLATFAFLKFYTKDGWTKEELDNCCIEGEVYCPFPNSPEPYYILDLKKNSKFDLEKLLPKISSIKTNCPELSKLDDDEIIKSANF